jgi:SPP1 gp7 family putative phage head morphogenesis protein
MSAPSGKVGLLGRLLGLLLKGDTQPVETVSTGKTKPRRPRRSNEEMALARAEQLEGRIVAFKENSAKKRQGMIAAGTTRYRWSSANDERVCEYCAKNQGKVFDIGAPTTHGFPGEVVCCNGQACRCTMTPLIEGVDY